MDLIAMSEAVAGLLAAGGVKELGEAAGGSLMAGMIERVRKVFGADTRSVDALDQARRDGSVAAVADLASALAWYARRDQAFAGELAAWASRAGAGGFSQQIRAGRDAYSAGRDQTIFNFDRPRDDPQHLNNPLIATVEGQSSTQPLTVDDEPPKEIPRSGDLHVIVLEARTTRAVLLRAMRPVVLVRRRPRRACLAPSRLGAIIEPRPFTADFDADKPVLQALGADFPFTVSATDIEQFEITPRVTTGEVAWHLELDWTCEGRRGTTIIDNNGKPFEIYPTSILSSSPGLDWGCGFNGHVRGCPAERLAARRRAGSQSIPQMGDVQAAIEEEFPGWAVWQSDAGIWYATRVGARAGHPPTLASDTSDGLRIRLRKESRES